MPNHVHAVVWFPEPGQLSKFMHGWKRKSSYGIRHWYRENAQNYFEEFGEGEKVWQPKYFAFEIETRTKLEEKLTTCTSIPLEVDWSTAQSIGDGDQLDGTRTIKVSVFRLSGSIARFGLESRVPPILESVRRSRQRPCYLLMPLATSCRCAAPVQEPVLPR